MKVMYSCEQFPVSKSNRITLENGVVDMNTGKFLRHSAKNYHRSGMNFNYGSEEKCDLWLKTMDEIFWNDADKQEKIDFLQEWFGYMLTTSTKYQVMTWLYGGGANGKSIITKVARALLGTANVSSIPLSQLSARFVGAELDGKLANIVDEIATDALLKEDEIKKIVSGDPLQVERKNKDPYFFSPTVKLFAATNSLPRSKDSTHGLDRRLIIVPCNRTFQPAEMDRDLISKLELELPGIFVWALAGLARLNKNGKFTVAQSCVDALEDFKASRNSVSLFMRDCLVVASAADIAKDGKAVYRQKSCDLYAIYKRYCAVNTYLAFGNEGFGKKLKAEGVLQDRTSNMRYYLVKVVNLEDAGISGDLGMGMRDASINDEFGGDAAVA